MNKDQKKLNQYPQWFEDLDKWQREDAKNRAVLICAVDKINFFGTVLGYDLSILAAIIEALNTENEIGHIIKDAIKINEDSEIRDLFIKFFELSRNIS